jgi:hypothetical protein
MLTYKAESGRVFRTIDHFYKDAIDSKFMIPFVDRA